MKHTAMAMNDGHMEQAREPITSETQSDFVFDEDSKTWGLRNLDFLMNSSTTPASIVADGDGAEDEVAVPVAAATIPNKVTKGGIEIINITDQQLERIARLGAGPRAVREDHAIMKEIVFGKISTLTQNTKELLGLSKSTKARAGEYSAISSSDPSAASVTAGEQSTLNPMVTFFHMMTEKDDDQHTKIG